VKSLSGGSRPATKNKVVPRFPYPFLMEKTTPDRKNDSPLTDS